MPKPSLARVAADMKTTRKTAAGSGAAARAATRGASQQVTPGGLIRKTVYLQADEWAAVRQRAFDDHTTESDLIRVAIRTLLDLPM